ncbi:MAG: 2-phospho-L-lactate guanylyltransferase [Chloroflexi bacterium]|nr:2-phospho-L-lactate guanylyltransferase [Chloroflexota bacterium]
MVDRLGERQSGGLWVVIPYKGSAGSKRRLAGLLDADARTRLSQTMFVGVLAAACNASTVERVLVLHPGDAWVVAPDHARLTFLAEAPEIDIAPDDGPGDGLNRALRQAQRVATSGGAAGLLMLPSDLPTVTTGDIDALSAAAEQANVVIAPDGAREGTNALLLSPPAAIAPRFGVGSFVEHQRQARAADVPLRTVERAGLALDLDTPDDVQRLLLNAANCPAARLLRDLGLTLEAVEQAGRSAAASARP